MALKPAVTEAAGEAGTHPLGLLVGEDAGRPSGCEVAIDFEGVSGAPLVGVHPVFTWMADGRGVRERLLHGSRESRDPAALHVKQPARPTGRRRGPPPVRLTTRLCVLRPRRHDRPSPRTQLQGEAHSAPDPASRGGWAGPPGREMLQVGLGNSCPCAERGPGTWTALRPRRRAAHASQGAEAH